MIDTSKQVDTPSVAEDVPTVDAPALPDTNVDVPINPATAVPTFRGYPVDMRPPDRYGPPTAAGRFRSPSDPVLPRPLFDSATTGRTGGALTRTLTCMHPFSAEVTFGAESFEDYMCQFMCGDVKFKDFRKASTRSSTRLKTIRLSIGTSCFAPHVYSGECGAPRTNPRKRILFTASGGLCSQRLSERKTHSCPA